MTISSASLFINSEIEGSAPLPSFKGNPTRDCSVVDQTATVSLQTLPIKTVSDAYNSLQTLPIKTVSDAYNCYLVKARVLNAAAISLCGAMCVTMLLLVILGTIFAVEQPLVLLVALGIPVFGGSAIGLHLLALRCDDSAEALHICRRQEIDDFNTGVAQAKAAQRAYLAQEASNAKFKKLVVQLLRSSEQPGS